MSVRSRFAPSPTGTLHLGNARTALYAFLYARAHKGAFILRIEDTDQERSTRESERSVIEDLSWLGLTWDEGPDKGGPHAPYRQSERVELYQHHLRSLLDRKLAYRCDCSEAMISQKREALLKRNLPYRYDGRCRERTDVDPASPHVVRFKISSGEPIEILDLVRGSVTFGRDTLDDFVLTRTDGMPVYNFVVVVDDHEMKISHVIRGEDHLTNTAKQLLLYDALKWTPPEFGHLSIILAPDGTKLSKRHGSVSVADLRAAGYSPEAVVNYLALLGWTSPDAKEVLSLRELIERFSLSRVHRASARFDPVKLQWLSGQYIHKESPESLADRISADIEALERDSNETLSRAALHSAITLVREACSTYPEFKRELSVFYSDPKVQASWSDNERALLRHLADGTDEELGDQFKSFLGASGKRLALKGKELYGPVRRALTGLDHGPDLTDVVSILGPNRTRQRLRIALG